MLFPATAETANISEIFSSIQGEGTHAGERHIFIRFQECHIHCQYCDELDKPGKAHTLEEVMNRVEALEIDEGPHRFISLTGGEPLLYVKFLNPLIARLREQGHRIYLETDGILWKTLAESSDLYDCIAMDMKPASVTGERNFFAEHEKFLEAAVSREVFVKMVLSKEIDLKEFDALTAIIARQDRTIPLVLQPITTDIEGHEDEDLMELLNRLQVRAAQVLDNVRIVPRLHKILGIR